MRLFLSSLFMVISASYASAQQMSADVEVFVSTASPTQVNFLRPSEPARFVDVVPPTPGEMVFDFKMNRLKQRIDGFGAAFTESCTMLVDKLSQEKRNEFLVKMFSKKQGAGFDNMRLPIGATDFSDGQRGSYSYDEPPGGKPDPKFEHFDMSRDENTIRLILEAKKINPGMKIMISPWSAPGWMKTSGSVNGGKLKKEHYQDFANYLVKVIQEYRKRGVPVTSMTIQNEPMWEWFGVPSMEMGFSEQSIFIRRYLGPTLKQRGVEIELWAFDHNFEYAEGVRDELLRHPLTRSYLKGVAFHCYGGHRFQAVNPIRKYPDLLLTNSECTGTDYPGTDEEQSFHSWVEEQAVDAIRIGHTGSIAWNLCLDENHGPMNMAPGTEGCKICRGMATIDFTKQGPFFDFNPEYYAFAQISKFVNTKSKMIEVKGGTDDDFHGVGILNDDGKIVFVVQNMRTVPVKISARGAVPGKMYSYDMPPRSVVTYIWKSK